jgi:N6-L-threonylcarbamoyladenine synthase
MPLPQLILGIETSCDETAAAVFDCQQRRMLSSSIYSQIALHENYGGVVPEIASRSQLEKINEIIDIALSQANVSLDQIDAFAVTHKPGLVGSLLVGICFTKGMAWGLNKPIIGVDHLEGHIFSSFLKTDGAVQTDLRFPHLCLSASGGHTILYIVDDFGEYEVIARTLDDAAGEAFDKIAKVLGLGYPGGGALEKLAAQVNFQDFFKYPRTKVNAEKLQFSFSGLKTAVLYDLVKRGAYDLLSGPVYEKISDADLQQKVASSLLVCITDIFCRNVEVAFKRFPSLTGLTFVGGVACNQYMRMRLRELCQNKSKDFFAAPSRFCSDNGAMIAFLGEIMFNSGIKINVKDFDKVDINPRERTDDIKVTWR